MRIGKSIVLALVLIFGFVMQCELFQTNLSNFNTGEYVSMDFSYDSEQEREEIISDIIDMGRQYSVHPFATSISYTNEIERVLVIYGDSYVQGSLEKEQGIYGRLYKSLTNGITKVEYHSFEELLDAEHRYIYTVSFLGNYDDITGIYEEISDAHTITYPAITGSNEHDMTYMIWITIDAVMLLMTILYISFKKKEITIRISMGQSANGIVFQNIILEVLTDMALYIGVRAFCSIFISGEYMEKTVLGIYLTGVCISSLSYISFAVYDIRRAFSNVFVTRRLLFLTYGIKFLVSLGTVIVIVTNIELVYQNQMSLGNTDFIDQYQDYSYLEIMDMNLPDADYGDRMEEIYHIYNSIYTENYINMHPAICSLSLEDDDTGVQYVIANEYGASCLDEFLSDIPYDENADVIYFMPKEYYTDTAMEDARYCLENMINESSGLKEQVVVYKGDKSISYVNRNLSNNMSIVDNPVIIYAKFHGSEYIDRICIGDVKNVMYLLTDSDIENINKQYSLQEKGYILVTTKVTERFEYYNHLLKQGISFCSSVAVFMLILNVILTVTIILMEYRNHAMELSLKKILGYGLFQRCSGIMLFSLFSNMAVILIAAVIGMITAQYKGLSVLLVGIVLLFIELLLEIMQILRIERENMIKILKGGSL